MATNKGIYFNKAGNFLSFFYSFITEAKNTPLKNAIMQTIDIVNTNDTHL